MDKKILIHELRASKAYLHHVLNSFTEDDAGFAPFDGMFTVAQHAAHAALSVDWFIEGATRPEGFSMDFEEHHRAVRSVHSLEKAKELLDSAYAAAEAWVVNAPDAELAAPLPEGPVLPGQPKYVVVLGIVDHTAHHRGALPVYARALGKVTPMPYEAQVPAA